MRRARLLAVPVALLVLGGCAGSPETEVRDDVNAVLAAANDGDAGAVRTAVDDLLATLRAQVGSGDLTAAEAEPVRAAALQVRDSVAALEVEDSPTPEPVPTQEETEEPSPTESPSPSPTPSPTVVSTPSRTPDQSVPPAQVVPSQDTDDQASELPRGGVTASPSAAPPA